MAAALLSLSPSHRPLQLFAINKPNSHYTTSPVVTMSTTTNKKKKKKEVWIWTENKQVMTSAVERGWNTFIFSHLQRQIATDWSSTALICPLFIEESRVFDEDAKVVATFFEISSHEQLAQLQPLYESADNDVIVVHLLDWQVIPAENIVATFHGHDKTVFAISKTPSEAQIFLEALEQGLGGVVLKTEDVQDVLELKGYFDKRNQEGSQLELTKATITNVEMTGMGDRVCVDLCSIMKPGEGVLVGSFARGLFLVHSECLESNYIASRPFRVNAVDSDEETCYSILLQNAETVGLVPPSKGNEASAIPVTSLKVGDQVLLKLQGAARHTGIEIQEFIIEK